MQTNIQKRYNKKSTMWPMRCLLHFDYESHFSKCLSSALGYFVLEKFLTNHIALIKCFTKDPVSFGKSEPTFTCNYTFHNHL